MACKIIRCTEPDQWDSIISQSRAYDFYHLAGYHLLHEQRGQGQGLLLVYREDDTIAALPILLRSLATVEGLSSNFHLFNDATSVYGYAGPVTNVDMHNNDFFKRFHQALQVKLQDLKVVALFSRLHPILQNDYLIWDSKNVSESGKTISIDLTLSLEEQRKHYRKDHKYDINKSQKKGVHAYQDTQWQHYDDFLRIYTETMQRVDASTSYYFDRHYFDQLRHHVPCLHLFVAQIGDMILSTGLFTLTQGIVQFHLSGSDTNYLHYAGSKVLLDEVRLWASAQGAQVFHLGGGVGAGEDSLFLFKAGFSDRRHAFKVWKWIINEDVYWQAVEERNRYRKPSTDSDNYFPKYRAT
jgi:lipid II:glycine glycyltransferase (peptidoglycan interpeptide bridge formation enzyme)